MKIRFGDCILDTEGRALLRAGKPVHLTPKAFQLLTFLIEVRPRAVGKAELQDKLWPDTFVAEGNLATLIKEARLAVGDDARQPLYIRTIHGYGYAFAGTVDEADAKVQSLLVLPFENRTGGSDLDYLCDGIAENITNAFSRLSHFRVLSPRTALRWKGSPVQPETIGEELQVSTVVHGRVTRIGATLAIQVDAVDVESRTQVWGNRFRAEHEQLFRIEEDVAAEVVDALQLRLSADDRSRLVHRFTSNPHAYDLYLRGRFHWNRRAEEGMRRGLEFFERAVVADPQYALPHSGIADVYSTMGNRDLMPPRDAFARALQSATRAIELAPSLAEAHASLGAIAEVHQWDWGEAGRKYRRAIELGPSYATAYQWYALHFARRGMRDEAEQQMARALDLDPLSLIALTNSALIAYLSRHDLVAMERVERALEIDAGSADALLVRGGIHEASGRADAAIADYRDAVARSERYTIGLAFLAHALAVHGDSAEAEGIMEELERRRSSEYVSAAAIAIICIALGRHDDAFAWLETAQREKSGWLVYLKTDRRFDPIRSDARFRQLTSVVGLENP